MNKLISVIIPVYNCEDYLKECLKGVLNQTYKNIEVILIDDGSTDNSGAICDDTACLDGRVKVLHKSNGGVSSARNAGISASSGEYITFIDSDDTVKTDMLEYLYFLIKDNTDTIAVTGLEYSEDGVNFKSSPLFFGSGFVSVKDALLYQWNDEQSLLGPCAKLYPSALIKDNGIFFDETIFMGEDRLFVAEILPVSGGIIFSDRLFYRYRWNEQSICRSSYNEKYLTIFDAFDKIRTFTDNISREMRETAVKTCAAHCAFYTAESANAGDETAVDSLKRIAKRYTGEYNSISSVSAKDKLRVNLLCKFPRITVKIYRALKGKPLK